MTDNSTAPLTEPLAAPVRQLPPTLFLPPFNDGEAWLVPEQERVVQLVILTIIFLAGLIVLLAIVEAVFKKCWPNSVFLSSRRRLLRVKYASSEFGFYAEMVFTLLSLCSCALFIYLAVSLQSLAGSDVDPTSIFTQPFVYWIEFAISALFALYYLFMLLTSMSTWKFVLNPWSIAQIVTIIPGLVSIAVQEYYWFFLPLRILQFNRSLRFLKGYGWKLLENRNSQIVFFLSTIFSYLFVATGFIFVSENSITAADGQVNNLLDALYLIVISLSTVGYGDIVPKSALGRVVIMVLIVGAIIIIPQELAKLIKIFSSSRNSTYSGELDHVVMYVPDRSDISSFIEEFFHEDRKLQDTNMALVSATDLHENTKALLVKPQYGLRVEVMRGELNSKFDQKRVRMMKARAAFLLTNKNPSSQHDAQTILTALNIAAYNKQLEVYVQIYSKEHKATALSRGIKHVVCIEELKLGLLAQNCLYLGFSTLIGNMIRSLHAVSHKFKYNKWLQDYDYGLGHECYSGRALTPYIGLKFHDVVMYIYKRHEALLFGIKSTPDDEVENVPNSHVSIHVRSEDGSTTANTTSGGTDGTGSIDDVFIVLNPGPDYVIQPGDIGFFIAQDERVVDTIVKDELGEYLGPDVWEQTMTSLNLGSHSSMPEDTSDQLLEKRKLALMKSGFNVKTSTASTQPGPVDEAILSDTEPRSGDSLSRDVSRERLDLSPSENRKHRKDKKSDKLTRVKPVTGHARRHSLDSTRDIGVPFSEEFKTREPRRSLDMGRLSFSDEQSRDSSDKPAKTNSKVQFEVSKSRDHSLDQPRSDKKKNSSSEQHTRSGSGTKSGKSAKVDPNARRTRKKDKILPRLTNKEMHGAGHIALDEDLIRNYVLVDEEPNFLSRASLYEVPPDMRDHIVIVCDVTTELYTLLLPLRAQSLQSRGLYRPVVLFSPRVPTTFHWNRICILPDIYFVRGSPTNTNDLQRAGVSRAWRVLILSSMSLLNYREYLAGEQDNTALDTAVDSTALLTFRMVQTVKNCSATPIVELLCPENSRYIVSVKLKKFNSFDADTLKQIVKAEEEIVGAGEYRNPNYASGQVFYATLLDTLIGQTYYNVDLLDILEELIKPDTVHLVALTDRPQLLEQTEDGKSECKLRTFLDLFTYFVVQEGALPLGIYRKGTGIHNGYVLTVPKKDEVIFVSDKVFLLNQGKLGAELQAKLQKIRDFKDR